MALGSKKFQISVSESRMKEQTEICSDAIGKQYRVVRWAQEHEEEVGNLCNSPKHASSFVQGLLVIRP